MGLLREVRATKKPGCPVCGPRGDAYNQGEVLSNQHAASRLLPHSQSHLLLHLQPQQSAHGQARKAHLKEVFRPLTCLYHEGLMLEVRFVQSATARLAMLTRARSRAKTLARSTQTHPRQPPAARQALLWSLRRRVSTSRGLPGSSRGIPKAMVPALMPAQWPAHCHHSHHAMRL